MAYTPNPDDATAPLDTAYASSAALEFRTLKAKCNQLFLLSAFSASENVVNSSSGFSTDNTGGSGSELLKGLRGASSRTGGTGSVLGGYFTGLLGNSVTQSSDATVRGVLVEAFTSPLDSICGTSGLNGAGIVVVQQRDSGQDAVVGLQLKFQDRGSLLDAAAVVAGLGDNLYNHNAVAIEIQSQARSTENERCGWSQGIVFENGSLDEDDNTVAHPTAINFAGLADYASTLRPVPFNFSNDSIETVAATNSGAVTPPTTLRGFIRFTVEGAGTFGIPVCSLAAL